MGKLTYKDAGVDTKEGERAVSLMKSHVTKTFNENVLTHLGGFGGLFQLPVSGMKTPVLVSGTDGVGTKLKIAFLMNKHDTVGIDCVAMCVNDILCQGAKPLFFLDYIATGKVKGEKIEEIVKGIAQGCQLCESSLIGGETAEMPGFYQEGEYDMAGFSVGIVDKEEIITGENIEEGDVIIGLPSSGLHSNGYSLVRRIFLEDREYDLKAQVKELGEPLGEALLRPTRIYYDSCQVAKKIGHVHGIVHITGGGFYENVPRVLPEGLSAEFSTSLWERPPLFSYIQEKGNLEEKEMFSTFNMGIGMMFFVKKEFAESMVKVLKESGEEGKIIGTVVKRKEQVIINGTT